MANPFKFDRGLLKNWVVGPLGRGSDPSFRIPASMKAFAVRISSSMKAFAVHGVEDHAQALVKMGFVNSIRVKNIDVPDGLIDTPGLADEIRASMRRREDDILRDAFGLTPSGNAPAGNLTAHDLLDNMAALKLPKTETWVVSKIFAGSTPLQAWRIDTPDETFTCMDPETWDELEYRMWVEKRRKPPPSTPVLFAWEPRPVFLDETYEDPEKQAFWAQEHRRIVDVMLGAISASIELQAICHAWWRRLPEVLKGLD